MNEKKWIASDGVTELRPFDKVLVRDTEDQVWAASWFSYYDSEGSSLPFNAAGIGWRYCILYKGNEHLAGTKTPISKPRLGTVEPFKWGERVRAWRSGEFPGEAEGLFVSKDADGYWVLTLGCFGATHWEHCERI